MFSQKNNLRKYGTAPYAVALIHGGPGAAGEMAPVATELSEVCGILEPLQSSNSIEGQIQELHTIIKEHASIPLTLIGHSWGAWLSFIFSARYPGIVGKLILIASGAFEEKYAAGIMEKRLQRINENEKLKLFSLIEKLNNSDSRNKNELFTKFGKILSKADSFDLLPEGEEEVKFDAAIFHSVWKEAEQLRRTGELLDLGRGIQCPVIAIHGDYDPHPAEGVEKPLLQVLKDFEFITLRSCGHKPWVEKWARGEFYKILKEKLQ